MKQQFFKFSGIITVFILAMGFVNLKPNSTISLEEAFDRNDLSIQLTANGNYSGNSVDFKITSPKTLKISIPSGYLFKPEGNDEQILFNPIAQIVNVTPNKENKFTLNGFCTQASNRCPKNNGKMSLSKTTDTGLIQLAAFIQNQKISDYGAIQEAIWCITDKHSIANVYLEDTAKSNALKKFLHRTTKLPLPWNSLKRKISIDPQGNISTATTNVFGNVSFYNAKQTQVSNKVIDSAGNIIMKPTAPRTIPEKVNAKLKFEISVSGWKKGKYAVIYSNTEGKELLRKDFII